MVTKAQFDADPYQRREVVTVELDWLGDTLCSRTGRPRVAAGTKGDYRHLNGGHRSQDFVARSPLCTNRSYTAQSGLTAEQERHIAAFDFTPGDWGTSSNRALMRTHTARLRAAMLDGRLAGVREVIGTLDGKTVTATRADGTRFSSDDSHLDHWHLTFDRRRCRDKALMERVVAVALGEDDDVTPQDITDIKMAILNHDLTPSGTAAGQPPTTVARVLLDITRMAKQIWSTDDIVQAPEYGRTEENPYWTAGNTLSTATHHAHEASVKADAMLAGLAQLAEALPGGQGEPEPLDYDRLADALLRRIAATTSQT